MADYVFEARGCPSFLDDCIGRTLARYVVGAVALGVGLHVR